LDCLTTRAHFAHKFENADRWLLQRTAAEQATSSTLAKWRSDYLKERLPTLSRITELGTGLGGDSVFLARNFELEGYEQDPARAILAQANLARLSPHSPHLARIHPLTTNPDDLKGELLFADPARRQHTRQFDPENWEPPLSSVLSNNDFRAVAIKTAPGLDLSILPEGMEVHFLSLAGNLKEAMLFRPEVGTDTSSRHAWLFQHDGVPPSHRFGKDRPTAIHPPQPGDYLHNPDPGLLRARLLADLADELRAGVVHPRIGYLCGPVPCPNDWATSFQVSSTFPLHWKSLNQSLRKTGWSEFEYLARGVPFSQAEVLTRTKDSRKRMKSSSGGRGSLIIYRGESDYQVVLANRT
jgi:hypothetical protein